MMSTFKPRPDKVKPYKQKQCTEAIQYSIQQWQIMDFQLDIAGYEITPAQIPGFSKLVNDHCRNEGREVQ